MGKGRISSCEPTRCSFCHKAQKVARQLISTPGAYPWAYICPECVAVCAAIVEEDRAEEPRAEQGAEPAAPHALLSHPLASELMACVAEWIRQESLSADVSAALGRLRVVASRMMSDRGSG